LDVQQNHLKRLLKDNFKVIDDYTEEKILVKNKKRGTNYISKIMITPRNYWRTYLYIKSIEYKSKNMFKLGSIKNLAREYQYKKNKEVYNIDFEFLKKLCIKCKNFIKQLEKEFSNNMKTTKSKLKIIKNNTTKDNKNMTSFYMIIDKK
jgi:hypothetical protein